VSVSGDVAKILKDYRISTVIGDKYSAGFIVGAFAQNGITYNFSDRTASEIMLTAEGIFNNGAIAIPDNERLTTELLMLERRATRGGRDLVGHPPKGHDDRAVAVCGVAHLLTMKGGSFFDGCNLQ
jgi:hypothetical protein